MASRCTVEKSPHGGRRGKMMINRFFDWLWMEEKKDEEKEEEQKATVEEMTAHLKEVLPQIFGKGKDVTLSFEVAARKKDGKIISHIDSRTIRVSGAFHLD